jgi:hypothetical protein
VAYLDASLPVEKRVEVLLNQMTTEEKVAQLCALYVRTEIGINETIGGGKNSL